MPQKSVIFLFAFLFWNLYSISQTLSQGVVSDVSKKNIPIEWNFTGTNILLFGAIDNQGNSASSPDVVIVVTGPQAPIMARRKQRIAGIWVNTKPRNFYDVPGYYSVVSNRAVDLIAKQNDLDLIGIGFEAIQRRFEQVNASDFGGDDKDYAKAIIRIMKREGLYTENSEGVKIIDNKLYRANIKLPANVPVGEFNVEVYLFQKGALASQSSQTITIKKQGVESFIYSLAYNYPFIYGVIAVVLAVMAGLLATAIFQKD